ncbi:MAG: O-methyltransferase [Clostridiales bacterium]|nr:O-methyltransferase [Clostridiales bacterium]
MEYSEIINKLEDSRSYAKTYYVPIIREESSKYLFDFIKNNNIKSVLEIGTAIGYSGSIMLAAGVEKLVTIDKNAEYLVLAKNNFENLGFGEKVDVYEGDAKNVIVDLKEKGFKFDMIFLDGAKGQYIRYLPTLTEMLEKDGVIFADNVLLHGMVESGEKVPHKKRSMVVNLRKYLEVIDKYPYSTELIRLEDGIAITKYIGE